MGLDLGNGNGRSQKTRMGLLLTRHRDRRYRVELADETLILQIAQAGTKQRAKQWQLLPQNRSVNV